MSGALLSHITTTDTARDLDTLRDLVGDRKITYVGLSYGTMLGQTYANLFPGRVRAMLLDGIVDAVDWTSAETRTETMSRRTTRSSRNSSPCANVPAPAAVRSPVTARPSPNGWPSCSPGRAARRSRHPTRSRPAPSATGTC